MAINHQQQRALIIIVAMAISFWSGRLSIQQALHQQLPVISTVPEVNAQVPMLEIIDIGNGLLSARSNDPNLRLVSGEEVVLPDENQELELSLEHLGYLGPRRPVVEHVIPAWANFVASAKGKYAYAIDEKSAKRLSPANRRYFATIEDAKNAGYRERSRR